VDSKHKITAATSTFKPKDPIYVSIAGTGQSPQVNLRVQLLSDSGALLADASHYIAPDGAAVSEFQLSNPNGWPPGKYKLQLSVDDTPSKSADITITD